ncbi:PEP-CTERM sorting domain-containing protein [uncultured Thiohalocapsa sp.]|uniref:PEP-CTERM sorting domain-containing protein n=1 Tax=uncultured Thiohalocapsa sp. TaxID=768990 RepID=UPI0025D3C033|nr:PEP-CTERM sorting domain-containing protein [uncultured Thiohalocapsa sp.]
MLSVCEWAYEDTGGAINAGDRGTGAAVSCPSAIPAAAPAPATPLLTLLGLGAMGVQAYRRRREDGLKRLADEQDAAAA